MQGFLPKQSVVNGHRFTVTVSSGEGRMCCNMFNKFHRDATSCVMVHQGPNFRFRITDLWAVGTIFALSSFFKKPIKCLLFWGYMRDTLLLIPFQRKMAKLVALKNIERKNFKWKSLAVVDQL